MTTRTRPRRAPDRGSPLEGIVTAALEDMKAVNVKVMDVRGLTDIADVMVVASGNSDRHVRSIADRVVEKAKEAGFRPLGIEGAREGEWVLVDLHDIILHVMVPRVREFYSLERMWETDATTPSIKAVPAAVAQAAAGAPKGGSGSQSGRSGSAAHSSKGGSAFPSRGGAARSSGAAGAARKPARKTSRPRARSSAGKPVN
jgi:ribosome-associated protein